MEDAIAAILLGAREILGVARARCYAMDPSGAYRLAASFGFTSRFGPEDLLEPGHPLIDYVQRHRRLAFVNSPGDAGPLGPLMEKEQYARALANPIYQGSRLIGILELQDKLGAPFGAADAQRAERLTGRIAAILADFNGTTVAAPEPLAEEDREALFAPPVSRERRRDSDEIYALGEPGPGDLFGEVERLAEPSASARAAAPGANAPELTRREVLVFKGFANALLLNPEVEAVVFSLWSREKGELYVAARRPFSESGRESLMRSLESALQTAAPGQPIARERLFNTEYPVGQAEGEIGEPGGLQTSVVFSDNGTLLLTLVFTQPPVLTSANVLQETHRLVRSTVLQVRGAERYRASYRSLIDFLVEPQLRAFPQIKAHAVAVAALCRRLATSLRLSSERIEQFTVAGLLHDIGLKELPIAYERISGRRPLDLQELTVVRQHPVLGANLLSRIEFPYPIAPLVLHHHERWDGAGYPDRLSGEAIPLGARVISIAEAYDAMVSPLSYRAAITPDAALDIILLKGGTQFDPELARRFSDMVRSSALPKEESLPRIEA